MKAKRNKSRWGKKGKDEELKGSLCIRRVQGRLGKEMR